LYDELSNDVLCAYAMGDENATELEIELAQRLNAAITEIGILVKDLASVMAEQFRREASGADTRITD